MYTQNDEEIYILKHFKTFKGTFLDIGAYDGKDLSNTRALAEMGWKGVLVEPDPEIFKRLQANYMGFEGIHPCKLAIGTKNGTANFWSNPTYYGSVKMDQVDLWSGAGQQFKQVDVEMLDWKTFHEKCVIKTFDFISIDAEGLDLEILIQMDLAALGCKMICVEHNGKILNEVREYCAGYGFKTVTVNPENIIMAL